MRNAVFISALFTLTVSLILPSAQAGRPLSVEEADALEPGIFELESGFEYEGRGQNRAFRQSVVLAVGLFPGWEAEVEAGYQWLRDEDLRENGWLDTTVRLRWIFAQAGDWSFGVLGGLIFPSGKRTDGFGNGRFSMEGLFLTTWESGPFAVDFNAGYGMDDPATGFIRDDEWFVGVAGRWELDSTWTLVSELTVEWPHGSASDAEWGTLGGVRYQLTESLTLDGGAGVRWGDEEPAFIGTVGLTLEF